jgi:hypothetical protein
MNNNEWDALLKLRDKAGLSAKPSSRLPRLENLIAYTRYLNTYTQEEKDDLLAQFKELSEQEQNDLWAHATYRTNPAFFHLTDAEVERLEESRKKLPFHDRARLLCNLILSAAGIAWLDLGEVFFAYIELDDRSSPERVTRPYAHLYFRHVSRMRVETIDILKSVRNDPVTVAHPAIAFAIYHWQQVIYTKRVIEREDITSRGGLGRAFKDIYGGGRDVRSAVSNLKAISETLYDAAEKRAIPLESALALNMQQYGLLGSDDKATVVYKAWDTLKADFIRKAIGPEEVLEKLEVVLREFEKRPVRSYRPITTNRMMEFLKDSGARSGRRFVWLNEDGNSVRPRWLVFRNAFAAWFFDLDQSTIQEYLERAKKQHVVFDDVYQPSMIYPTTHVDSILRHLLTNPLVAVREPVWVDASDIGFPGVEKAIKKASSDTD